MSRSWNQSFILFLSICAPGVVSACSSDGEATSSSDSGGTGGFIGDGGSDSMSGDGDGDSGDGDDSDGRSGGASSSGGDSGLGGNDGLGGQGGSSDGGDGDSGDGDGDSGDGDGDIGDGDSGDGDGDTGDGDGDIGDGDSGDGDSGDGDFSCIDEGDYLDESFGQESVSWVGGARITVDDDGSVTSTTNLSYGSYAYSAQSIDAGQDGHFEFTTRDATGFFGISSSPTASSPFDIDFALQIWSGSNVYVIESGAQKGKLTTWQAGDVFAIRKQGSVVTYRKNGETLYTSAQEPSDVDYRADFAFGGDGKGFDSPKVVSENDVVSWRNVSGVTVADDGSVTSMVNASYGAHAYSAQSISRTEDGYFEFTPRNLLGFVGLSDKAYAAEYADIDYALQLWSEGKVHVVENGSSKGVQATWMNGDVFRIEKRGSTVRYVKNGCTFYTSMQVPGLEPYHADFAFGGVDTGFGAPILVSGVQAPD